MKINQMQLKIISVNLIQTDVQSSDGFLIYTKNDLLFGDYSSYTTLYRELDGVYQYSNDGSIYIKPIPYFPIEEELKINKINEQINVLYSNIATVEAEFKLLDYIGNKISTGRGTVEEYKVEIAKMDELAKLKNEVQAQIDVLKEELLNEKL